MKVIVFALALLSSMPALTLTSEAWAGPGTCKCNGGCHSFPGQCTHSNGCSQGYAPQCGNKANACPQVGWVSCDGTCVCTPTLGPPDGGSSDGGTSDAGSNNDSGVPILPDGGGGYTDAALPPPSGDAGCDCPDGSRCVGPDNFCAGPCGNGEFPCRPSEVCTQGYCVPVCLVNPCPSGAVCDPSSGICVGLDDGGVFSDGGINVGNGTDGGAANSYAGDDAGCGCTLLGGTGAALPAGFSMVALGASALMRRRRRKP